ncbi:MAG: tail fiber domain-containing protein [Nanoarchaeota archaeon]
MQKGLKFALLIFISLFAINLISASLNVSLSDQASNIRTKSTGVLVNGGNLVVSIYDDATAGNLIYTETFTSVVNNGSWSVMLGESTTGLPLEFGKIYYRDYTINGEDVDFTNAYGQSLERRFFYSPLGDISGEDINQSASLIVRRINASATSYLDDTEFNGGWENGGVSIRNGAIYADTGYFYNLSKLNVTSLNVNGSIIPMINFDNNFDLGAPTLRWRDLWLSRNANVSGNVTASYFHGYINYSDIQNVPASSSGNPFDQSLNTTDRPQLQGLFISGGGTPSFVLNWSDAESSTRFAEFNSFAPAPIGSINLGVASDTMFIESETLPLELRGGASTATVSVAGSFKVYNSQGGDSTLFANVSINNQRVGILTTTPTHTLNVFGTSNLSGNTIIEGSLNVSKNLTFTSASSRFCNSTGVCYSLTDLNTSSVTDFTNVAWINQTNIFTLNQNFSKNLTFTSASSRFCDSTGVCYSLTDLNTSSSSSGNGSQVPAGSITAFNLASCPVGWSNTAAANDTFEQTTVKGWVRFNGASCTGTGNTCVINDSFNVDNVTRFTTGNYTIHWTNDFANANYTAFATSYTPVVDLEFCGFNHQKVGSVNVVCINGAGTSNDVQTNVVAMGDGATDKIFCEKQGTDNSTSNSIWGTLGNYIVVANSTQFPKLNHLNINASPDAPANAEQGSLFYNSTQNSIMSYNGSTWLGLSGVPQGTISAFNLGVGVCPSGWSQTATANQTFEQTTIKAWVNFNGTAGTCGGAGNTCALGDSFNVDNVSRTSTGNYSIYWTNDFSNGNYVIQMASSGLTQGTNAVPTGLANLSTERVWIRYHTSTTGGPVDISSGLVMAMGDGATNSTFCEKIGQDTPTSQTFWGNSGSNLFVQDTSWNVGIGTSSPSGVLNVIGRGIIFNTSYMNFSGLPAPGATANTICIFGNDTIAENAAATCTVSDLRLKENVINSPYGLKEILKLRSIRYNDIADLEKRMRIGLGAQEVLPIMPELVGLNPDGTPHSVNYESLTSVLAKGMQEQQTEIEFLKSELCKKDKTYAWCS